MKTILMATMLLVSGLVSAQTAPIVKQPKLVIISDLRRLDQEQVTTLFLRQPKVLDQMNDLRDLAQRTDIQILTANLSNLSGGRDVYFEVRRNAPTGNNIFVNVSVVRPNATGSVAAGDLQTLAADETPNSTVDLQEMLLKAIKQQKENLSTEAQYEIKLKAAQKAAKDF